MIQLELKRNSLNIEEAKARIETLEAIIDLYESGFTIEHIALVYKISIAQVSRILKENNIKTKGKGRKRKCQ